MTFTGKIGGMAVAMVIASSAATAHAQSTTFNFDFQGIGTSADAKGSFTIANAALADINAGGDPGFFSSDRVYNLSNLTLHVTGGQAGNATYTTADFYGGSGYTFQTTSPLDFSKQLVGQQLANGAIFGPNGSGDFNLFSANGGPIGFYPFTFTSGNDNNFQLVSLQAAAPEPATWAMMFLGLGIAGYALNRKRKGVVATNVASA